MSVYKIIAFCSCVLFSGATYANAASDAKKPVDKAYSWEASNRADLRNRGFYALNQRYIYANPDAMPGRTGYVPEGNGQAGIP